MYRSKNQFFKQTVCSIWLIASLQIQADSSLNLSINKHQDTFETAAMKIWDWAEVGYQEYKSSELLKNELQSNGFSIQSGVAEIPTAFIAEYSNGGPVIGILGEYDALPGLMQTSSPFKEIKDDVDAGHACGHHLFGAAVCLLGNYWPDALGYRQTRIQVLRGEHRIHCISLPTLRGAIVRPHRPTSAYLCGPVIRAMCCCRSIQWLRVEQVSLARYRTFKISCI